VPGRAGQRVELLADPDDVLELEDLLPGWRMPLDELWRLGE
jgi:hypothetical protein